MRVALVPGVADETFRRRFDASFAAGLDATLARIGMTRGELERELAETGAVRIVEVDGQNAGSVWTELRGRTLHVHALVLDDAYRHRRIGAQVLSMLESEAAAVADELELGVEDENLPARRLYEKAGFEEVDVRPGIGFRTLRKSLSRSR